MDCLLHEKCKQASVLSSSIFIILVITLKLGMFNIADKAVYNFFKEHENTTVYNMAIHFSYLSGSIGSLLMFSIMMLIFLKSHKIHELLFSVMFAALSVGITIILKYTLLVQRPLNSVNGLSGYSFPSGHGVLSIVLAIVFFLLVSSVVKDKFILQIVKFLLIIYVFVSMLARLYVGSHWMSDILGSILLAVFVYLISCLLFNAIKSKVNL